MPHECVGLAKGTTTLSSILFQATRHRAHFRRCGGGSYITHLDAAQAFVNQYQLPLFGGMKFYGETYFFLPQILLELDAQQLTATVFY